MIKVAVVEDENRFAEFMLECISRYESESGRNSFKIELFRNGLEIVENYRPDFDIIFLDIDLPHMNGIEAAKRIRKMDKTVIIIFVTNLAQYAINGYEVNAFDYVVKPIGYRSVADKLDKVMNLLPLKKKEELILLKENNAIRMAIEDIYYIEVSGHVLMYHTKRGNYQMRGRLTDKVKELSQYGFSLSSHSYLVNYLHVKEIGKDFVLIEEDQVPVSRGKRKTFLNGFMEYLQRR